MWFVYCSTWRDDYSVITTYLVRQVRRIMYTAYWVYCKLHIERVLFRILHSTGIENHGCREGWREGDSERVPRETGGTWMREGGYGGGGESRRLGRSRRWSKYLKVGEYCNVDLPEGYVTIC